MNKIHQSIKMIDTFTAFIDAKKPAIHAQIPESELTDLMEQDTFDTAECLRDRERAEEVAEDRLSDRQRAHKDAGMKESDFY